MKPKKQEFFVAGGTLRSDSLSYVERPADRQLRELTAAGHLCYVLTTRQIGKSSLMVRTAVYLEEHGIHTALIDLTDIGAAPIDAWYLGLLDDLQGQLSISTDAEEWWEENNSLGHVKRFSKFIQEVILTEVDGRITIFIDEIDSMLKFDFADDFFAVLRYMYNARAVNPEFRRLSFVLIGVATPGDLISDSARTPFNVGEPVDLDDFTLAEAEPLAKGLADDPLKAAEILQWIFHWTGGHPYLTQRLCRAVVAQNRKEWSKHRIADLVNNIFLGEMSRSDSNLMFVRDMLTKQAPDREAVLLTYRNIYSKWRNVPDDQQSLIKSHLKLSGVVRRKGDVLRVRNLIYETVFGRRWIREHLPGNWWSSLPREVKFTAVAIFVLLFALLGATLLAFNNARLAQESSRVARSRQLMTQSATILDTQYDLALLLGSEALSTSTTPETEGMMNYELIYNPYLSVYLRAHADRVNTVSISANGELLASGSDDGQIILWDLDKREPMFAPLEAHKNGVASIAFSNSKAILASGACAEFVDENQNDCVQGEIAIWGLNGEDNLARRLMAHEGAVRDLAFSPNGQFLASVGGTSLILWDVDTLNSVWKIDLNGDESISSVSFSPIDSDLLVLGDESGRITVLDVGARAIVREFKSHSERVADLAFSPNADILASGSRDGTIALWEVSTWQPQGPLLERHTDQILDIEFGNNDHLVSVSLDGQVLLWNLAGEPEVEVSLNGHGGSVRSVAFKETPDEMTLISNGPESSVIFWDLKGDLSRGRWLTDHQNSVLSIDFSPDGSVLVSGSADQSIILWDIKNGTPIGLPHLAHDDAVRDVAFQPQGNYLASAGRDGKVILWQFNSGQIEPKELVGHAAIVRSVVFSPDGSVLASSDDSGKVFLWDVEKGRQIGDPLTGHKGEVFDVAFSPDGKLLASGSWDGTIRLWDLATLGLSGEPIFTDMGQIWDIEFSPDGELLAVAGSGERILIYNVAERDLQSQLFTNHINRINTIDFSPDGKLLASGSLDSTIEIWNVPDRKIVGLPLRMHSGKIHSLKFSPDGRILASADSTGKIRISIVDYESPKEIVCDIVSRNLTEDEWAQYVGHEVAYRETCSDNS